MITFEARPFPISHSRKNDYPVEAEPYTLPEDDFGMVITGSRRTMMQDSPLRPYFATRYGDMMVAGCFRLLTAVADKFPNLAEPVWASLQGG